MSSMQGAPDDVVIQICRDLSVRDILAFRQTCKHAFAVSCLKTLWVSLCATHVTAQGIPFPDQDRVSQMSAPELEMAIREALDRNHRLRSGSPRDGHEPKARVEWEANSSSAISEVLFVPDPSGHEAKCIVTVSKGIWCLISLWDIQAIGQEHEATQSPKRVDSWSPKGAVFSAIAVNPDPRSKASAAVAVNLYGGHHVYILSFFDDTDGGYTPRIHVVRSWDPVSPTYTSLSLCGDVLVAADSCKCATVVNVHSPETRIVFLESTTVSNRPQTSNVCLQIQISQRYILVARAMFIEVFTFPVDILTTESTLGPSNGNSPAGDMDEPIIQHPVDSFSFGWLDGISISQDFSRSDSFFVLFRQPNENPWSTHTPILVFYRLELCPTVDTEEHLASSSDATEPRRMFLETFLASVPLSPFSSPTSTSSSASTRLVLGNYRTALWHSPRPRELDSTGLVQMDLNRQEDWPTQARRIWRQLSGNDLVWGSLDLRGGPAGARSGDDEPWANTTAEDTDTHFFTRRVFSASDDFWTAIGYDEETGRVAIGKRDGYITFLRL